MVGGSKSLPPDMAAHLKEELVALIADKFTDADGKRWSQERLAEVLDCSQTQVSDLLKGKKAGISTLIAMSRESGKTIDELLGPTAPSYRLAHKNGVVVGKTLELLNRIQASGFGFAGKNLAIPALMKELRTLLEVQDDHAYRAELRSAAPEAKGTGSPPEQQRTSKKRKAG